MVTYMPHSLLIACTGSNLEARIAGRLPPFQGAQGREGLVWLRHRMGWP